MIITEEFLKQGESLAGAWNYKQLELLGVDTKPLASGWKKKILGKEISEEAAEKFLRLKNSHLKYKQKYKEFFNDKNQENLFS